VKQYKLGEQAASSTGVELRHLAHKSVVLTSPKRCFLARRHQPVEWPKHDDCLWAKIIGGWFSVKTDGSGLKEVNSMAIL